jgi:adenine-specific DNA-methyltransferase
MFNEATICQEFAPDGEIVLFPGDCLDLLDQIPDETVQLVVTSPPYNIGKEYEDRRDLDTYLEQQAEVIAECTRVLAPTGSICWQVGNYVENGAIVPLDAVFYPVFADLGLRMRNRIVWHFGHGLHCKRRFSGRHETIMWFTKTDDYIFNLDPVRVPQKYKGKRHYKGPNAGKLSCNPKGKNPSDVWNIPNVKSNHVEKTGHPCQFPVGLVERLVLSMTEPDQWVLDPFLGSGTSVVAAIRNGRRGAGAETEPAYVEIAEERIEQAVAGTLRTRPMLKPVYQPPSQRASTEESKTEQAYIETSLFETEEPQEAVEK